jgi:G:T-mismatch repair DNA endonuclease (very short patch repair protein)
MKSSILNCNKCKKIWHGDKLPKHCSSCYSKDISIKSLEEARCLKCNATWGVLSEIPRKRCPSCSSSTWDKPLEISECNLCLKKISSKAIGAHKRSCTVYSAEIEKINRLLTFDFLNQKITIEKQSALSIANSINPKVISAGFIINAAKKLGIKTLSVSESLGLDSVKKKREATVLDKYGDTNVLGGKSSLIEKRNNTVKEKYGVDNVFQLESTKEKMKKTYLKKYGVDSVNRVYEIKKKSQATVEKNVGMPWTYYMLKRQSEKNRITKPHLAVENILNNKNISFVREPEDLFKSSADNGINSRKYFYLPDIWIPSKNVVIEIYGDFWHANSKFYKESDILKMHKKSHMAGDIWQKDAKRISDIESCGIRVLIVWENEINNNPSSIEDAICKFLELNL